MLCRVIKRIGGKWIEGGKPMNKQVDGDKFLCLDKMVKSNTQCLIYSFGISNDWTFEDQMDNFGRSVFFMLIYDTYNNIIINVLYCHL